MSESSSGKEAEHSDCVSVPEIVLLGLGNVLLRDEGVGVHAVREFLRVAPKDVLAVEVGTAALHAAHLLAAPELLILFDALEAGGAPGSVYAADALGVRAIGVRHSIHEFDILVLLQTMRSRLPEILILGVEPEVIDYGLELSAPVRAAVPLMVDTALSAIHFWQRAARSEKPPDSGTLLQWVTHNASVREIHSAFLPA